VIRRVSALSVVSFSARRRPAIELGVLQRDRGLGREDLRDVDVVLRKRPGQVAIHHERAERALAGQERHRQHGAIALGLDDGARRRRQLDRRIAQDVGRPHRALL
jgi:hypothetical protein